jgi:hypothetical protein
MVCNQKSSRCRTFLEALAETIGDISRSPQRSQLFMLGLSELCCAISFFIVFREDRNQIEVIAIAHAKRRPGYWRKRRKE